MSDPVVRQEGFYWVILGQNPPEIAYWERGEWWLAGDAKPWQPEAVTVASDVYIAGGVMAGSVCRCHQGGAA